MDATLEPYDVVEPVVAYRCWTTKANPYANTSPSDTNIYQPPRGVEPVAYSQSFSRGWSTGDNYALACHESSRFYSHTGNLALEKCNGPVCDNSKVGTLALGCGFYALKQISHAYMHLTSMGVMGKILMWGKVWPHVDGYRSSHARIVGFYNTQTMEPFTRWYGGHGQMMTMADGRLIADLCSKYQVPLLKLTEAEHKDLNYEGQVYFTARALGYSYEMLA